MSMYPIASGALSSFATNITSISQNFTHLQLRLFMRSTAAAATAIGSIQFNSDAGASNYNSHSIFGNGTTGGSGYGGTNTFIALPAVPAATGTASVYGGLIIDILDYTSTVKNKTIKIQGSYDANGSGLAIVQSGLWFKTPEAINTINLGITTGWDANSRWDLYGVSVSNVTGA
jgi:hypothetical protein